jgi:hypothetical protein
MLVMYLLLCINNFLVQRTSLYINPLISDIQKVGFIITRGNTKYISLL